jgi:hypothetical protein
MKIKIEKQPNEKGKEEFGNLEWEYGAGDSLRLLVTDAHFHVSSRLLSGLFHA